METSYSKKLASPFRLKAPAKLNLGLRIVGQRGDGYHLLESLFWPISFSDSIEGKPSTERSLKMHWSSEAPLPLGNFPKETENTVFKILEKTLAPLEISIEKQIPMGGGLGGGSSDAGTLLRHFVESGTLTLSEAINIATKLGADVPFFLNPAPSWVTGIGENRQPLRFDFDTQKSVYFTLLLFPFPTPTAEAFSHYQKTKSSYSPKRQNPWSHSITKDEFYSYLKDCQNDLEPAARALHPLIGQGIDALRETKPLLASLSGSGSTCFALYDSQEASENSAKGLQQFCRTHHCRTLTAVTFATPE